MNITRLFPLTFLAAAIFAFIAMPADARNYYVRETKGTVEIKGWEKGLLKRNPNLKRWHWNPITANYNRMKPIVPGKDPWKVARQHRKDRSAMRPNVQRYMRPNHIGMPVARNSDGSHRQNPSVNNPLVSHGTDNAQYRHDVDARLSRQRTDTQLGMRNTNADLSWRNNDAHLHNNGQLARRGVDARLANHDVNGQLSLNEVNAQLGSRSASGKLAMRGLDGKLLSQNIAHPSTQTVSAELVAPVVSKYSFDYRGNKELGFDDAPTFVSGSQSIKNNVYGKIAGRKYQRANVNNTFAKSYKQSSY
ncbi:MAG: hypothetical protein IAF58_14205 [Leptolyngbya sp.]|nr:hypothetical protein [Candidatus Melainabacteria bacterium]